MPELPHEKLPDWFAHINPELREAVRHCFLEARRNAAKQCDELLLAGWRYELPEIVNRRDGGSVGRETEPWQWYWRRPPRRKGSKGRRFNSTSQAYMAMKREKL